VGQRKNECQGFETFLHTLIVVIVLALKFMSLRSYLGKVGRLLHHRPLRLQDVRRGNIR